MTSPRRIAGTALLSAVAALAYGAAAAALAQTAPAAPAANAPAAAPAAGVVPESCGEKPEYPGHLGSDNQKRNWLKAANAYLECLKKDVDAKQAAANKSLKIANDAIDNYNAAAREFTAANKAE